MKSFSSKVKELDIKLITDENGNEKYTIDSYKILVKFLRDYLKKFREPMNPNNKTYNAFHLTCSSIVAETIHCLVALIKQGDIEKDSLGLLDSTVTTFGVHNKYINSSAIPSAKILIEERDKELAKESKNSKQQDVSKLQDTLTDLDVARIIDSTEKTVNITTKKKSSWIFDKIKRTFSFKDKQGKWKTLQLDKKQNWRQTVSEFFYKMFSAIWNVFTYPYRFVLRKTA